MIIRQTTRRQSQCIFCSLLPSQSRRTVTSRADLAIPRHNLLEERITGPNLKELTPRPPPVHPFSSPRSHGILQRHKLMQYWNRTSGTFGSVVDLENLPGKTLIKSPSPEEVTLELLMASQAHMGHSTSLWNPLNSRYIFGERAGIHIISLEATASHLKLAAKVVEDVAFRGGLILFVGTRKGQRPHVVAAAQMAGGYHLFTRWVPGTITNGQQLLGQCKITPVTPKGEPVTGYEEEIKENLAVLKPHLVVCMNPLEHRTLLRECAAHTIPTIGVIDTDADPTCVTYPIPANDDSLRCSRLISGVLGKAGERGRLAREELISTKNPGPEELPFVPFDLHTIEFKAKSEMETMIEEWKEEVTNDENNASRRRSQEQSAAAARLGDEDFVD